MDNSEPADVPSSGGATPAAPLGLRASRRIIALLGSKTLFLLVLATLLGVGSGYGAVLFRKLITVVQGLVRPGGSRVATLAAAPWWTLVLPLVVGGAVVGPLIYFLAREAKGHGVPEVMDAVANQGGRIRPRVAIVKILASAISIGAGGSVGREGPIVQIGSSLGSSVGQILHLDTRSLRLMVACGAAGGIAATFNAPIAGVLFSLEIIIGIGSIRTFTPLVVTSVVATVISRFYLGDVPAFAVPHYHLVSSWELALYVLLGVLCALVGVVLSRGLYKVEDLWDQLPIHEAIKPALGGLTVGLIAVGFPHIMGAGYETIERVVASDASFSLLLLLLLVLAKVLATHMSLGSGLSGGVFAPSLFVGGALGGAFGLAVGRLFPEATAPSGAYALVAMGGVVAAATHAPLTVILIVFEMTGDYRIILPLMLCTLIASTLSVGLSHESIYTLKLFRRGAGPARPGADRVMHDTKARAMLHAVDTSVRPGERFNVIVERAIHGGVRPIYVTSDGGRLEGIIYLEDVSALIRDEEVLQNLLVAADVMRPPLATLRPDDSLARSLRRLGQHDLGELPVVDGKGVLLGALSRAEILLVYDREVLQQDTSSMAFVERQAEGGRPASVVQIPSGEHVATVRVTGALAGKSLRTLDLRARHEVFVHGVRSADGGAPHLAEPNTPLKSGDLLMLTGPPERIEEVRLLASLASADIPDEAPAVDTTAADEPDEG